MLAKSAAERFQSAGAVLEELRTVDPDEASEVVESDGQRRAVAAVGPDMSNGDDTEVDHVAPTRESSPAALREKLARDSSERTAPDAGSSLRVGVLAAAGSFFAAVVIVVVVAGMLAWRSRAAREAAIAVSSELEGAAAAASCDDDPYEPNDRSFKGTELLDGEKHAILCPGDVDWFRLGHYSAGDVVRVAVDYDEGSDDIDVELFVDAQFEAGVYTPDRRESFERTLQQSGVVALRVYYPSNESGEGRGYTVTRGFDRGPAD
jgi:hypothetical protein